MIKELVACIASQDDSHLALFLLEKGYELDGVKRRPSFLKFT
jgi:GDP-D-mannose dehydratase